MTLRTLKPKLAVINLNRVVSLAPKGGATPRTRGRAWMATRHRVFLAHDYQCLECRKLGRFTVATECDHIIPLEQGGADDDANLQPLCLEHHAAKTAAEAKTRARA